MSDQTLLDDLEELRDLLRQQIKANKEDCTMLAWSDPETPKRLLAALSAANTAPAQSASPVETAQPVLYICKTGFGTHYRENLDDVAPELRHMWKALVYAATELVRRGAPSPALPEGLVELLREIRPKYGAPGSRDVDVAEQQRKIDAAIALIAAAPNPTIRQSRIVGDDPDQDGGE